MPFTLALIVSIALLLGFMAIPALLPLYVFQQIGAFYISMGTEVNWLSLVFTIVVLVVFSSLLWYSAWYMSGELSSYRFCAILSAFVVSMLVLINSNSLVSILLGWDGLGLSSFYLVMYFNNYKSSGAGITTVLSNRVGDVFIILGLLVIVSEFSSTFFSDSCSYSQWPLGLGVLLMSAAITKSAMYPYSVWLPEAMAAPTPVSSLVHSSTLVTAGVILMIRFYPLLVEGVLQLLSGISCLTLLISTIGALGCMDFKKIIALSTLSQLSFMMVSLSLGGVAGASLHLLTHALFKSSLFMAAGWHMHTSELSQECRSTKVSRPFMLVNFCIPIISMSGMPMTSGFISKEMILLHSMSVNGPPIGIVMLFLGCLGTLLYSGRMLSCVTSESLISASSVTSGSGSYMSHTILLFGSIWGGSLLTFMSPSSEYTLGSSTLSMSLKTLMVMGWCYALYTSMSLVPTSLYWVHSTSYLSDTTQGHLPKALSWWMTSLTTISEKQWVELMGPQNLKNSAKELAQVLTAPLLGWFKVSLTTSFLVVLVIVLLS